MLARSCLETGIAAAIEPLAIAGEFSFAWLRGPFDFGVSRGSTPRARARVIGHSE